MPFPPLLEARRFDPSGHLPLTLADGPRIGWVQRAATLQLSRHPLAFAVSPTKVSVRSEKSLADAVRDLAASGWIRGWRNEGYPVPGTDWTLERAAFRPLGLPCEAVHLNGWVEVAGRIELWVARRSPSKPVDPGLLDNVVGGGIGAGYSILATLEKECGEEAGIPPELAARAQAGSSLRTRREVPEGVHDETIHVCDLELPPGFAPENRDGEVSEFERVPLDEVVARLAAGLYTVDAGLATLDFLWRRGVLDDPAVGQALAALARPPEG